MKHFQQDIFQGSWNGIVHCANLYHVMGGGIARIIHRDIPEAYEADCLTPRSDPKKLGHFSHARVLRPLHNKKYDIFNLYGQMGMGNDGHPMNRNARYDAIHDGLYRICEFISVSNKIGYTLAMPHGMASGLAGGDFDIVLAILSSVEKRFPNIEFHIYKL